MTSRIVPPLGAVAVLVLAGCAGPRSSNPEGPATPRTPSSSGAAVVVTSRQLHAAAGNLLNALRDQMAGMRVRYTGDACPEITLRGTKSLLGSNSPVVYVDGARAANTCILDMLNPLDVSRVEVYPMGAAPRPPYQSHPNGLILVFLENGSR